MGFHHIAVVPLRSAEALPVGTAVRVLPFALSAPPREQSSALRAYGSNVRPVTGNGGGSFYLVLRVFCFRFLSSRRIIPFRSGSRRFQVARIPHVFPGDSLPYSLPIPRYYDSYSHRFPRRCSPRPSVFPLGESTNTYERSLGHWSSLYSLIPQAVSSAILVRLSIPDRTQRQSSFALVPLAGQVASLPILILLLWPEKYQSTSAPLDKTLDKGWGIQAFASSKG